MLSKNKITPRYTALTALACPGKCLNGNSLIISLCCPEASRALPTPRRCSTRPQNNKGLAAGQGPKFCLISGQFEARRRGAWPAQSQGSPLGTARPRAQSHSGVGTQVCSRTRDVLAATPWGPGGSHPEQQWFELHSSLLCRRLVCSNQKHDVGAGEDFKAHR